MNAEQQPQPTARHLAAAEEIKPCPFCGEAPQHRERIEAPHHNTFWPEHVYCIKCSIIFRPGEHGTENAVTRWNTRAAIIAKHEQGANECGRMRDYLIRRRRTIEASIAAEKLAGNEFKEARERTALAEITAMECEIPWSKQAAESLPSLETFHNSVFEYDGAFKCTKCGAVWGAISGTKTGPCEHAMGQPSLERISALRHAVYVCDSKNHSLKNESYRAACDEIKISLLAAISRVEGGEQMESVAVCQSSESLPSYPRSKANRGGRPRMSNVAGTPENMSTEKNIQTTDAPPRCAPSGGSAYDRNTARIREECERRLGVVKNGVESAIFALAHMNPRLATEYLDDVTRYGALAKLDTEALTRRLNTPND